ncbi:MAG: hypothetical protein KAJ04_05800 [Candidatus Eisenbacteria sp.]|nr:hypothetical protein [Candidatus Eisenbacteria bacterium]
MKSTTGHRTTSLAAGVAAAVILAACLLAGCSSSTGPEYPPDSDVHYFARTEVDSVMANLRLAYENQHLTRYMYCLAEDFTFYPSESTLAENEWIPESWGRVTEHQIHNNMFRSSGFVHEIVLGLLQEGEPVEVPGPNPGDPVTYEYTFGVDLCVNCQDSLQYVATAPSLFVLRIDPDEVGPAGEPLWEIIQWFDLDEQGSCGRPVMPTSWGELKAIFLDIDLD